MSNEIYVKGKEAVLISRGNFFIYEVCVFCRYKNYYSMMNNQLYRVNKEIPDIVPVFWKTPYTQIKCSLFSAPLSWLLENGYVLWTKPEKVKRIKKETPKPNGKQKTTIGKSRSWEFNG